MNSKMRVGFYVRNRFQVSHFRTLFEATPGAVWVGKSAVKLVSFGVGSGEPIATSRFFLRRLMDRAFDVVVSQAAPPGRAKLKSCKFVMVQYGYAKEPYNYGEWRSNADLILAYGQYAADRFSERAPSVSIGNPRMDDWNNSNFLNAAIEKLSGLLLAERKTVLYAPTWGDLSSMQDWLETVEALAHDYNVLIKAHHNSTRQWQAKKYSIHKSIHYLPDNDLFELMAVADVVISDLSGAIFDAVMCNVPVVLISPDNLELRFGNKLNADSIEVAYRDQFGIVIDDKNELGSAISTALALGPCVGEGWKARLFHSNGRVSDNFRRALFEIYAKSNGD